MRLEQKYFVPFLAIMAIITALLITFFTVSSQKGQRQAFRNYITSQDSLSREKMIIIGGNDSLSVSSFSNKFVILDFWATWSNFSEDVHIQLAELFHQYPNDLKIIAAVVQDQQGKVDSYISRHEFPFHFVHGTNIFNKYKIPGIPTEIIYNPEGEIIDVFFGYSDSARYDSLRSLMKNGR